MSPAAPPAQRPALLPVLHSRGQRPPVRCLLLLLPAIATCVSCARTSTTYTPAVVLLASNRSQKLTTSKPLELLLGVDRGADVTFHRCVLRLPEIHGDRPRDPAMLLSAGRQQIRLEPEPISEDSFRAQLAAVQPGEAAPDPELLIVVHGYATQPGDAVIQAGQLAHDVGFRQNVIVFSWPTRGLYLSYLVDGINAEWSVPDFVRLLELAHRLPGSRRIHILGHSVGARIVLRGVKDFLARRYVPPDDELPDIPPGPDGKWFGQIVLVAADEDTQVFERSFAPLLARSAARTTIYFSTRDRALDLAGWLFGYPRLGKGDCPRLAPSMLSQIQSIDATRVDRGFIGHFYYTDSPEVLADIQRTLAGQSAADPQRPLERKQFYQLLPYAACAAPPPPPAPVR